jgi:hypothetical protein
MDVAYIYINAYAMSNNTDAFANISFYNDVQQTFVDSY